MDLKGYKKTGFTGTHTIFEHPDGHQIHVNHKKLPKDLHDELRRIPFAEGGAVQEPQEAPSLYPKESVNPMSGLMDFLKTPIGSGYTPSADELRKFGSVDAATAAHRVEQPQDSQQLTVSQEQQVPALENVSLAQPQQPMSGAQQQSNDFGMADYAKDLNKGFEHQKAGVMQEASVKAQQGQEEQKSLQQGMSDLGAFQSKHNEYLQQYEQEQQALMNDLKNTHIDPRHYLGSMGTGQKIQTGIGLLLGGFAGFGGRENPVLEMLNKEIDRDIRAQEIDIDKKHTLLSANMNHFKNVEDARAMTKVNMLDLLKMQIQNSAAKAQGPMAKAAALQALGPIEQQQAALKQRLAMNQTLANTQFSNPDAALAQLRVLDPQKAKEMEERYVPGIGFGSIKIEPKVREEMTTRKELDSSLQKLSNYARQHSGSLNPQTINEGKSLASNVQDLYRRANQQGVFRETEMRFVQNIIDQDPTKFFAEYRTLPKYKAAIDMNRSALNMQMKAHGLRGGALAPIPTSIATPKGYNARRH